MMLRSNFMMGAALPYESTLTPSEYFRLDVPDKRGRKLRILKGGDGRFHALDAREEDHVFVAKIVPGVVFSTSWR